MCWISTIFHRPCGHWGKDRNRYPCARAWGSNHAFRCPDSQSLGTTTVLEKCPNCIYRDGNGGWMPFRQLSDERLRCINEQLRRRLTWWTTVPTRRDFSYRRAWADKYGHGHGHGQRDALLLDRRRQRWRMF
ncbi:MAG: hypothetical protein M1815_000193 [Lichina confinis]|nr:MAG: hypothetical protein M1815_000193 [Lichina confinis]